MSCPRCRAHLAHPVVRAVPTLCALPAAVSRTLMSVVGRSPIYRATEKQCLQCGALFRCAELAQDDLFALAAALKELHRQQQVLAGELEDSQAQVRRFMLEASGRTSSRMAFMGASTHDASTRAVPKAAAVRRHVADAALSRPGSPRGAHS